jgi:PAT family acetyl-CoA transporter-like MFS transporter 1
MPLEILLPLFINKYTTGSDPMALFMRAMPIRLLFGLVFAAIVKVTPQFANTDGTFPLSYYVFLLAIFAVHQVTLYFVLSFANFRKSVQICAKMFAKTIQISDHSPSNSFD